MSVVVCARRERGGLPERGARDQYIPDAGAGSTGEAEGEGREGKEVCGPRTAREGVACRGGTGDDEVFCEGCFDAIADVERRFRGRGTGLGDEEVGVEEIGGERGFSGLGVLLPLLCAEGGFELFDEALSFCESD